VPGTQITGGAIRYDGGGIRWKGKNAKRNDKEGRSGKHGAHIENRGRSLSVPKQPAQLSGNNQKRRAKTGVEGENSADRSKNANKMKTCRILEVDNMAFSEGDIKKEGKRA